MSYLIYSVKDNLSGTFSEFLLFTNDLVAIRYFNNFCKKSDIKNDLDLYKLGSFDTSLGKIEVVDSSILVARGIDVIGD